MTCITYTTALGITTTIHYFYDHAVKCCCGDRRLKRQVKETINDYY